MDPMHVMTRLEREEATSDAEHDEARLGLVQPDECSLCGKPEAPQDGVLIWRWTDGTADPTRNWLWAHTACAEEEGGYALDPAYLA